MHKNGLLTIIFSMLTVLISYTVYAGSDFKIITLQHRFPEEVLPTIQSMVGENGLVTAMQNNLLIRTTPDRMGQIEQVVATFDTEQKNLRITVSHDQNSLRQNSSIGGTVNGSSGNVQIQIPSRAPNGITLGANQQESSVITQGSEFVSVVDGQRAFIRVGQSIPFTQQWVTLAQRYVNIQTTNDYRDITTGFAVRPKTIGNRVELEITPRISRLGSAGYIDFEELSTVVMVTQGQWFDLGGTMQSRDEVSRTILSRITNTQNSGNALMIKVD